MGYMSSGEAARRWDISERRVRILCSEGRVDGAVRSGWSWNIPDTAGKPGDGRLLRHIKNFSLRSGSFSLSRLEELRTGWLASDAYATRSFVNDQQELGRFIAFLLEFDGVSIPLSSVMEMLSGRVVPAHDLDTHVLVVNVRECILLLVRRFCGSSADVVNATDSGSSEVWSERIVRDFHASLTHGLASGDAGTYRAASVKSGNSFGADTREYPVETQMKSLFFQYDRDWPQLHPVVRGAFLCGELLRIQPFPRHNALCAWLVLCGEFMREGFPPPLIARDNKEELGAALVMTVKRGNYQHMMRLLEDAVAFRVSWEAGIIPDITP
ncbi:hypothetical protein [Parasphaerochaeta coccoides]|uniref:Fido domain-containing protein n=1 Tax=Parasphaerochaeta coccoides (strain ATCC BAA-1237 / DSM 17374 / SPN1) TaxID=760011 RepID=F4GH69_PARC1|nr:hypothetical protein [Parasphaerochaeta coccoides]AEC01544.1 hypothetical protein Spico_0314 [Parasphaerochaeta coccoides DSM 17374]